MKWSDMKTTLDVLNYASQLVNEVENGNTFADYRSAKEEAERLERYIEDKLESGAFEGQARHDLRVAKYFTTSGINQARKNQFEKRGWKI